MAPLPPEKWFPHQDELPPLPLPSLEDTCERYLESVQPLLTPEAFEHTKAIVADFKRPGGAGMSYQEELQAKAASERNWMEVWWEQLAYLRTRTTMAVHINWFGVMPDLGIPTTNVQAAAITLHCLLEVKGMLETGVFPIEKIRGNPLDMNQFTRVFGMTRVPAEGSDNLVQASDSKHVVVLRKNAMYSMPLYRRSGEPLSLGELQAQIAAVLNLDAVNILEEVDDPPISLLTSLNRDEWAAEHTQLLASKTNAASLKIVEEALFCVALDDRSPNTKEEAANIALKGMDGRNRWFDKSFTVICFENGRGGLNAEHTPVDAMTIVSIFMHALDRVRKVAASQLKHFNAQLPPLNVKCEPPVRLSWEVSPRLQRVLERASASITALTRDCQLVLLHFNHFGKGLMKRAKLHPDFFMQMAIQLAYFKLHGRFVATYETGHTRAFYHGRTDTVRTLSMQSMAFVKAMQNPSASSEEKFAALKTACEAHGAQLQRVLTGQGIDRHLLGLYICAVMRGELPPFFSDEAYKLSGGGGNYIISTSNVGYTPMMGGFAPMTPDGYGVCYAMLEGRLNVSITAWRSCEETCAERMRESLIGALVDMMELCGVASPASKL